MEAIVRDGTFVLLELDQSTNTVQQTNIQRFMDKSVLLCLSLSVISWRKRCISIYVLFVFFSDYEKESEQCEKNDISSHLPVL